MNPFEPPDNDQWRQKRTQPGVARAAMAAFFAAVAAGAVTYLMGVIVLAGIAIAAWGALLAIFEPLEMRSRALVDLVVGVALVAFFLPKIDKR